MTLTLQPIRVATGFDEEGMMVLDEEQRLVAVLTHLSDRYGSLPGHWYLEAGFGRLDEINHPTFSNLDMAKDRIGQRLTGVQYAAFARMGSVTTIGMRTASTVATNEPPTC
jgi:hypothetical protein